MTPEERVELEHLRAKKAAAPTGMEAFGTGLSQGASLGFADELAPLAERGIAKFLMSPEAYQDVYGDKSYKDLREGYRQDVRAAREAHPIATGAGQLIGALPASVALGGTAASIPGVAATSALEGAITGAGSSEADLGSRQFLSDVIVGGTAGAAFGGLGAGVGKAVGGVIKKFKNVSDDAADALKQLSEKAGESKKGVEAAVKQADDIADELDDFADDLPYNKDLEPPRVTPTQDDSKLAKFGKYQTPKKGEAESNIAYIRSRPKEAIFGAERIHLDPNQPNNLQRMAWEDLKATSKRMKAYEKATDEILADVTVDNKALLDPFRKALGKITGRFYSPDNEGVATVLLKYLRGSEGEGTEQLFRGLLDADGPVDARQVRQFIRDMRSGNVSAYKGGQELRIKPRVLKKVAAELNDALKEAISKAKGADAAKAYSQLMEEYAQDTSAFVTLKKAWEIKPGVGPQRQTWYDRYVIYPLQKIVDGDRSGADAVAKSLIHIGKRNGRNYLEIVKDNLVISELFPDMASGIDRGTLTRTVGRAAGAFLQGAKGNVLGAGRELAGAALDASDVARREMLKKILMGQKGIAAAAEKFYSGVSDFAGRASSPLIEASRGLGKASNLLSGPKVRALAKGAALTAGATTAGTMPEAVPSQPNQSQAQLQPGGAPSNRDQGNGLVGLASGGGGGRSGKSSTRSGMKERSAQAARLGPSEVDHGAIERGKQVVLDIIRELVKAEPQFASTLQQYLNNQG